jgi:4-diphosphocytidyl-2-C-methyl-D-erythritol kinase
VRLRALAPGKVNLCLFLGGLRDDGRHQLVTLFESVSLADEVELTTRVALADRVLCPGVEGPNIVSRALEALRARGWEAPPVEVKIDKRIPVAGGMGGGSADAAATLRIAERLAPMPEELINHLAAELGSDVPSQLEPGLVVGTGAGEVVQRVWPLPPLTPHAFVIVPAGEQLSTAAVYAEADRIGRRRDEAALAELHHDLKAALRAGGELPGSFLVNDLQAAALSLCPRIEESLAAVRDAGADHTFVCGSGPTVAGLYWGSDSLHRAAAATTDLAASFPGASAAEPATGNFGLPLFA